MLLRGRLHYAGEGIYFAAKSGRMCAEAIVEGSAQGKKMIGERDLRVYLNKCAPGPVPGTALTETTAAPMKQSCYLIIVANWLGMDGRVK